MEFFANYAPHFFNGSQPYWGRSFIIEVDGEAVGHINYDGLDTERSIANWIFGRDRKPAAVMDMEPMPWLH